jgi:toxin-antitoxin system PIN domain toxin
MTYLLDVNLLIALAWPSHIHHSQAQNWFARKGRKGWASCPMSQAGFVRISSNPKFIDGAVAPKEAILLLRKVAGASNHQFWPDDVNFAGQSPGSFRYLIGHRQVTDAYLLAIAISRQGMLATLDPGIRSLIPDPHDHKKYIEMIE